MPAAQSSEVYTVRARNTSRQSENLLHDDAVAKQLGFAGGLVPGINVFAYLSHLPLQRWGRAFLERGCLSAQFTQPIYDGEETTVRAIDVDGALELSVESRSVVCATGRASLPDAAPVVVLESFASCAPPDESERPAVSPSIYQPGQCLGIRPFCMGAEAHAEHLAGICETHSIYRDERILHPGTILRLANFALMQNATLGPWIHLGGTLQNLQPCHVDDILTIRSRVVDNREKKQRRLVETSALVVANGTMPVALLQHSALYSLG